MAGLLAMELAVPAPAGIPRMDIITEQIAARLADGSPNRYGPLVESDVQAAVATFRDLGARQPDTLLHGDLQGSNVLRSLDGDWVVIGPLGLVGDPALEALTMLRTVGRSYLRGAHLAKSCSHDFTLSPTPRRSGVLSSSLDTGALRPRGGRRC